MIFGCKIVYLGNNDKKVLPTTNIIPKEKDSNSKDELAPFKPLKTVWQICCRRDFLLQNDIFFQEDIKTFEDVIFRQQAVAMSKNIRTTNKIAYTWNRRITGASSLTMNKNNTFFGELRKLVKATRRIGELARQYDFSPETEKYFKKTVLEMPIGVFYITMMSLFYKMSFNSKDRNREEQENIK